MILLNKTGEKTEEDQATDPRARRSRPGCGASSSGGATCNRAPPPDQPTTHPHFLPGMKFMYGNIRASITHVEYHDQQLEALPWRHFVGKCILAPATEAARWKYALERPFPFPAPFVSSRLPSPREPVVEPKPLESSSTTLQAFTTTNHLLPIYFLPYFSPRVTLALLSSSSSHLLLETSAHVLCTRDDNFTRWEQIVRRTGGWESVSDRENRVYLLLSLSVVKYRIFFRILRIKKFFRFETKFFFKLSLLIVYIRWLVMFFGYYVYV